MSPNAWASSSRPSAISVYCTCTLLSEGGAPTWPMEAWIFCAWIAAATSSGVIWSAAIRTGSIQTRMLYCDEPMTEASPTPFTRESGSVTFIDR